MNRGNHPPLIAVAKRPLVLHGVVAIGTGAVFWFLSFRGTTPMWLYNPGESGLWLDEAARVLDGQVMYRDFFEFVGPGVVYINALLLGIMGQTAFAAQLIPVLAGVVLAVLLWRISAKLLPGPWPFFAPLVFVGLVYPRYNFGNHKWLAWIFALTAIDLMIGRRFSTARLAGAGACVALATLSTQDLGMEVALGLLIAVWPHTRPQDRVTYAASAALVGATVLGYFGYHAGFAAIWYDLVVFPLTQYRNANGGFALAPYYSVDRLPIIVLQWLLSIAAVAAAVVVISPMRTVLRAQPYDAAWCLVAWPGLMVVLIQSVTRAVEPTQTTVRALVLLVALAGVLRGLAFRFPRTIQTTTYTIAIGSALVVAAMIVARQSRPATLVATRAGTVWALSPLSDVEWLQSQTLPGERVFLFPDKGGYFFLSGTRNATSYPYLQDMDFSSPGQVAEAVAQLAARRPRVGMFDQTRLYTYERTTLEASSLLPLYRFLTEHYRQIDRGRFLLASAVSPGHSTTPPHASTAPKAHTKPPSQRSRVK